MVEQSMLWLWSWSGSDWIPNEESETKQETRRHERCWLGVFRAKQEEMKMEVLLMEVLALVVLIPSVVVNEHPCLLVPSS